ncbi:hypothetical protein D3C79_770590 [compost metagenome]
MGAPDVEVGRQLLGLIAEHGAPAPVEDDELAGRHMILPDAQAGAVHGGIQLFTGILGDPFQALVLQQQPVMGLPQLLVGHSSSLPLFESAYSRCRFSSCKE